jgi:lipoprotein-releasing system ATP-binding protein
MSDAGMPFLDVRDLRKEYRSGAESIRVLRGVTFGVHAGEFVAVVGQSGCGKSTLLHLLGGLDRPSSGEILVEGKALHPSSQAALDRYRNRQIGFIFQAHHLLPEFTALENVMVPALIGRESPAEARARAAGLLAEVGLTERLEHRPGELSGGEQQRVAVARALVMSPRLVLADEPTGNLDQDNSLKVFELLRGLNRSRDLAVIMVTHNAELARRADRTLSLDGGVVTAGPTATAG